MSFDSRVDAVRDMELSRWVCRLDKTTYRVVCRGAIARAFIQCGWIMSPYKDEGDTRKILVEANRTMANADVLYKMQAQAQNFIAVRRD